MFPRVGEVLHCSKIMCSQYEEMKADYRETNEVKSLKDICLVLYHHRSHVHGGVQLMSFFRLTSSWSSSLGSHRQSSVMAWFACEEASQQEFSDLIFPIWSCWYCWCCRLGFSRHLEKHQSHTLPYRRFQRTTIMSKRNETPEERAARYSTQSPPTSSPLPTAPSTPCTPYLWICGALEEAWLMWTWVMIFVGVLIATFWKWGSFGWIHLHGRLL